MSWQQCSHPCTPCSQHEDMLPADKMLCSSTPALEKPHLRPSSVVLCVSAGTPALNDSWRRQIPQPAAACAYSPHPSVPLQADI